MKTSRMQGNPAWFIQAMVLALALYSCGGGGGGGSAPPPPTVTTSAAATVTLHTATLNGVVNPHAQATNAFFEWGTDNALVNPTLTTAQAIGAGSTDNSVSAAITGLTFGTTYYFRVVGVNASGTQKGAIVSFATGTPNSAPTVTTGNASSVTISGAVLNGSVNPNELAVSDAHFEYGTSPTLATFSTTATQTTLGAGGTSVDINASLSGLTPGTTYYFRVVATNSVGTSKGAITSFATVAQPPTVVTGAATSITITGATLNGTVNPNGLAVTDSHFEYGTSPTLATFTTIVAVPPAGSGFTGQAVTASPSLAAGTTYYFRVVATNSAGTSTGSIVSFITVAQPPTVATAAADNISVTGATLHGTVNPNGLAVTDAHFEYGTSPTLATFTSTANQSAGSGLTDQAVSASVSGLTAGTTYYFRVAASNSAGTTKGLILSFTTIVFSDDFSTDTTGTYTLTPTSGTGGTFTWDSTGQRVQVLTGIDNVLKVSKAIPAISSGVFSLDFNPTTAYPSHGGIWIRLVQDANNYYEISNFDYSPSGNPPGLPDLAQIIKVVGGVVTDNVFLPQTAYTQTSTFNLSITFSPTQVILQGFGSAVTLNTTNTTAISATGFEIETGQQDAFYDNILLVVGP